MEGSTIKIDEHTRQSQHQYNVLHLPHAASTGKSSYLTKA